MRLRLALSMILVALVSVLAVSVFARLSTAREVNTYMFRGGMAGVNLLVDALERYYQVNGTWVGVGTAIDAYKARNDHAMGMDQPGMGGREMMRQPMLLADSGSNIIYDTEGSRGGTRLSKAEAASAIELQSRNVAIGYLYITGGMQFQPGSDQALIKRLNTAAINAALLAGAVSVILAMVLGYLILRPVQRLTTAANRIAGGDLAERVPVRGKDELAELGGAFNTMAASLEKARENRKAMTADIAHELRTPLAVQKAILEAIQDGVYPLDQEQISLLSSQNQSLTRLVDDLRTLALADAGELRLEKVATDLVPLTGAILAEFQPAASAKNIQLLFKQAEGIPAVSVDPFRIGQIIKNLVSNAIRYSPAGSEIRVRLVKDRGHVAIEVWDRGPGLTEEDRERVFERFYRGDPSRSREEGGTGLGLAIARQLARLHHGDLAAVNHPEGGALFRLRLPLGNAE